MIEWDRNNATAVNICSQSIDYQGIIRHINEGVLIIREEVIVFANSGFETLVRSTLDTFLGRPLTDLIVPEDRGRVLRHCQAIIKTSSLPDRIEFSIARPQETTIVEMKTAVIDCQGPAILAALTDITQRRKDRLELQQIKDRLESILHSMNDVVISLSTQDNTILAINPAAEALYGIPRRDFGPTAEQLMQFVHPEDREKVQDYYHNLIEEEFDELQYRIVSKNGRVKWVHDEGRLVYCTARSIRRIDHVIRDITEQKEALDALTRSEKKYRNFFHHTKDMAYSVTPEGHFIDINKAGIQLLGFSNREEALSANLKDYYENLTDRADFLGQLNEKGFVTNKHVRFRRKDGRTIEVAITARAKTDESGYLISYEGIAHNITQALEDQRNRVLRNAAGGMCHYLNTHLMHIINANEGIAEEMDALEELMNKDALAPKQHGTWLTISQSLHDYISDLTQASHKITTVTKAFNSAFLTYKEEAYLDKTILDIFSLYLDEPGSCSNTPDTD